MSFYRFRALGPFFFSIKQSPRHRVNKFMVFNPLGARNEVFAQAEDQQHRIKTGDVKLTDIKEAIGLYVIGLKSGRRLVPYYVGKAVDQTIYTRLFQPQDKTAKVQAILNEQPGAKPFVFLFPMVTPTGRLARRGTAVAADVIDHAEYMMIGHAMHINPWLHNVSTVAARESFLIDGSPQADERETDFAKSYRRMMGFAKPARDVRLIQEAAEAANKRDDAEIENQVQEALAHPEELVSEVSPEEAVKESEATTEELADEADRDQPDTRNLDAAE